MQPSRPIISRCDSLPYRHASACRDGGAFHAADQRLGVNAGARLHRFPEQRCINDADENALEHGLVSWTSSWGRIVFGRVGDVVA